MDRLEKEVYDYMKACEAKEEQESPMVIAHHSCLNPLVCSNHSSNKKVGPPLHAHAQALGASDKSPNVYRYVDWKITVPRK